MSEERISFHCVSQLRCRLCQLPLVDGDSVVVAIGYEKFTPEFKFSTHLPSHHREYGELDIINIHFWLRGSCYHHKQSSPCFHTGCLAFKIYDITPEFLAATYYRFQPSEREVVRRIHRTKTLLVPRLKQSCSPAWLPTEVWLTVASYLVRECLLVSGQIQARDFVTTNLNEWKIDFGSNVYASYVVVDGRRYVSCLRNSTELTAAPWEYCILQGNQDHHIRTIWVAEDHLGIRNVHFTHTRSSMPSIPLQPGVWWRMIDRNRPASCDQKSDGLKLRDIGSRWVRGRQPAVFLMAEPQMEDVLRAGCIRWPTKELPSTIIDLHTVKCPQNWPMLQMEYFDCNAQGTTGYTTALSGYRTIAIHAHGLDTDLDINFYNSIAKSPDSIICIFTPLDRGEYVTEISRRCSGTIARNKLALIFTTNYGRISLFGYHEAGPKYLDRVYSPPRTQSRIYYNTWDSEPTRQIKYLAFDGPAHCSPQEYPYSVLPKYRSLRNAQGGVRWFYSSCNLGNVKEVTVCINASLNHRPIIGMLVQHKDGHKDCLGQFRFDYELQSLSIGGAEKLFFGCGMIDDFDYVGDIGTHHPLDTGSLCWIEIPLEGILEWKCNFNGTLILHKSLGYEKY